MHSLIYVTTFFISLLVPFVFTLANPCTSYFPLGSSVTNTSLIPHTFLLPQILSTDGYTPGNAYTFTIETVGAAKINTFFLQVQTQDSTPVGTFVSVSPSQSVITCHGVNDSLIGANFSTDQNLTSLSVTWIAHSSALQLTSSLYLVYTLGVSSISYQRYKSQPFLLKDFCSPSPCQNSGSCQRHLTGGYSCVCQPSYFGLNCQHFNACTTLPCLSMGSCVDQLFGFECDCLPGYTGRQCEVNIDECQVAISTQAQHPCMFNGTCIDGSNSFSCECKLGYAGNRCQTNIDDCTTAVCGSSGSCVDLVADYVCNCEEGTAGRNCEISHQCSSSENVCLNNAVCLKNGTTGETICVCHSGFSGPICSTAVNHCTSDLCRNGATCHSLIETYLCDCSSGWEGTNCDIDIDECATANVCNNGICVNRLGSFECFCSNGFAGELCDLNLPDCYNNLCSEYSTCVDGIGEYTCVCPPGRTGVYCDTNVDLCMSNPCRNNASCTDGIFSHSCACLPGYTGASCEVELNECDSSPCLNSGTCVDRVNAFECMCRDGFAGLCCEINLDDCASQPCENGETCKDGINDFACECMPGFASKACAEDVDECLQLPCLNNATCSNTFGSFSCTCQSGFTGDLCGSDIDECDTLSQPCLNGGSCVNTVGNYSCECPPSYKGVKCQTFVPSCDNYDQQGNSLDCDNNGTCIVIENVVTCQCRPGYTGMFCETPFDPCLAATCSANSTCVSQGFTYTCICPPGVTGDDCSTDVMECESDICENNGMCMELFGSFMCMCGELFSGQRCETPLNFCEISHPCTNNGTCSSNQPGTPLFNCTCPLGYAGEICDMQIDYCESNPCSNNGNCTTATYPILSGTPVFTCSCPPGYTGATCSEDIDECPSVPCSNNATCLNLPGTYSCDCTPGFTGARCEQEILECQILTPCLNNGTCIEMIAGYICECATGYTGENCSDKIDFCMDSPCNNGSCVSLDDGYKCICSQGVTGSQCATDIPECASQPCMNQGICEESFGSFACLCPSGFTGTLCEEVVSNCVPDPCLNEGICVDSPDSFECFCKLGYTGRLCHININDCASSPCLNGGTCEDGAASFSCECTTGYAGPMCSIDIDSCQPNPCTNNSTCIDLPSAEGYKCNCIAGYTGVDCGEEVDECSDRNCSDSGRCIDMLGGYSCVCDTGFSGGDCETKLNMCSSSPCANGGDCVEVFPFFECICTPGFTGEICQTDINDCATNPCLQGTCVDGMNTFMCLCPDGFTGITCQSEIFECTSSPCVNNGTCMETMGAGFVCICGAGYTGDICQLKINFCESQVYMTNPCVNGNCVSIGDTFICVCEEGFTGERCEHQLPSICVAQGENPCYNNGTCIPDSGADAGFNCICSLGYTGERCEYETNECITSQGLSPCLNGTCIDLERDFYCVCSSGYTGRLCDTILDQCANSPCLNGVCRTVNGQFFCLCYDGYTGDLCEVDIDDCESSPCQNNGTCLDRVNSTVCTCQPGYSGMYCENRMPMCDSNPCLNEGECIEDPIEGYRCMCPTGVTGNSCDIIITFCREGSCFNGAVCVDVENGFQCVCPTGFTGERCEYFIDFCASSPCSNNATCTSANSSFSCLCMGNYFGVRCQYYNNCVGFDCNYGDCVNKFNSTSKPVTSGPSLIASGLVSCVCLPGYTGQLCESLSDTCTEQPDVCSDRGTCFSTGSGGYRCECDLGYAGKNCQTLIQSVYFTESSFLELLPVPNSLNQYTIDLSIQTNDSSALLLYTAQDTSQNEEFFDFLLVQIISGQVRVTFDCGSGPGTVQTNFAIDDGKVHNISIAREGRSIQLTVDGRVFNDLSAGDNTQQTLSLPLFIGGLSNYSILPERFRALNGYTGCVHTISVSSEVISLTRDYTNAVGLQTCQESSCGYVRCQNGGQCVDDVQSAFRCICPDGYRGSFCEVLALTCVSTANNTDQLATSDTEIVCYNRGVCKQVGSRFMCACVLGYSGDSCQQVIQIDTPLFSGEDSFLTYSSTIDLSLMFNFSFSFRPLASDGVILYSSQFPALPVGDYALLQIYKGYIQFIFDCGSGRLVLNSSEQIVLNTWQRVRVERVGRVGHLYVNSQPPLTGSSLGAFARLNLDQNLYIGGFDSRAVSLPSEVEHSSGLVGCIEQFNSSNQTMLSEATAGLSISPCPDSQCNSSHCLYGGTCLESVSRLGSEVTCSCQQGYSGERCQNVINVCETDTPCKAGGICQTSEQGNSFSCLCPFGKEGPACEEDFIPILPKLSSPHSYLQYPLIPHVSLETWNRIEFSFTFDFSTVSQTESTLRNLMYFGSEHSTDFIALVLDYSGATPGIQLQYNLGSGIQTAVGPDIQQDILYSISLTRYQQKFTLSVNGETVLQTSNPGSETALDLPISSTVIVIGALSPQLLAHSNSPSGATGVRGCLHTLTINLFVYAVSTSVTDGLSITDCLQDICINSQPCLNDGVCVQSGATPGSNIVCLCRLGFVGDNCAQEISVSTASFSSYSSLSYPPIPGPISDSLILSMLIKLDTLSGKLLIAANQLETEFLRIELIHGVLVLKSHLGEANSDQALLPSRWYNLTIVITTQKISVLVDGGLYFELSHQSQVVTRDALSLFTLGTCVLSQESFQGCIGNVTINHDDVTLVLSPSTAAEGRGISQCVFSRQCSSSVCTEHGVCSLSEELAYSCNCYEGFTGETCDIALLECDNRQVGCVNGGVCRVELVNGIQLFGCICQVPYTGDKCQYKSTLASVYFNSNSYLGFPSSFLSSFKSSTVIELVVMPESGDGVLFFAQNIQGTSLQDYIYIGLRNSKVEFRFDLGTGSITLSSGQAIQLGKPISIRAQRNEQFGELYIDSMLEASGSSPGSSAFFAVNSDIYLGGVPNDHLISPFGSHQGFQGCIGSFQVGFRTNTIPVAFNSATSGIDIRQC